MKILALLLTLSTLTLAKEKTVTSSVDNVVVFKDRAFVTRGFISKLSPGNTSIKLSGLTNKIMQDSVKIKTSDNKNLKVLGLRVKKREQVKSENEELNKLLEESHKNNQLVAKKIKSIKILIRENEKLKQLQDLYTDSFAVKLQEEKWSKKSFNNFVSFTKDQKMELVDDWKKSYTSLLDLYEKREFLNSKINELNSNRSTTFLDIYVDLEIKKKAKYEFDLQYLINGANWEPVYDIRVNSKDNSARLYQYAYVSQTTGEDWEKAKIELSNRRSKLKITPPSIYSYNLSYKEVKKVKTKIQSTTDNASSLSMANLNQDKEEYKFIVSGVQTIKSGSPRTRVFIKSKRSKYQEHLEVVPKLYEHVYRKGTLKNNFNWNLQPGIAYIYYDNQFIQTMPLEKVMKSKEFHINAGIDYNFKVTQWFSNKNSEKGLINSKKVYKRTFHTKIENFSNKSKKLKVLAQYPVSETKEITVSTDGSSEGLKELKSSPSWSYWDVNIGPNTYKTQSLKVEVVAPKDFGFKW